MPVERLDRLRVGQGVGDGAHAAGPLHDRQRAPEGAALGELLEAAMDEAQPRVEVEDPLADRREAEVAGLDDAGVDRADRQLVDALALDLERHEVALGDRAAGPRPGRPCAAGGSRAASARGAPAGAGPGGRPGTSPSRSFASRSSQCAAGTSGLSDG